METFNPLPLLPPAVAERMIRMTDAERAAYMAESAETVDEAQERAETALAMRRGYWTPRVPLEFREASTSDLTADQSGAQVQGWLASDSRVLVCQSETPGNGKSHAAYAVGNEAVVAGLWTIGYTVIDYLRALRPSGDPEATYATAIECDLLVLDDLGKERTNEWTTEQVHSVLDSRWGEGKRVVVTTNLTGAQMIDRYGAALVDRIVDGMTFVQFTGPSRRKATPW